MSTSLAASSGEGRSGSARKRPHRPQFDPPEQSTWQCRPGPTTGGAPPPSQIAATSASAPTSRGRLPTRPAGNAASATAPRAGWPRWRRCSRPEAPSRRRRGRPPQRVARMPGRGRTVARRPSAATPADCSLHREATVLVCAPVRRPSRASRWRRLARPQSWERGYQRADRRATTSVRGARAEPAGATARDAALRVAADGESDRRDIRGRALGAVADVKSTELAASARRAPALRDPPVGRE
jgi:hypothetical protein